METLTTLIDRTTSVHFVAYFGGSPFYDQFMINSFFLLHVEAFPTTRKLMSARHGHQTQDLIIMSEKLNH